MTINYQVIDQHQLAFEYLDTLQALMEKVINQNAAPYLYPPEAGFFERILGGGFVKVIALDAGRLVGFSVLRLLDAWPSYLKEQSLPAEQSAMIFFTVVDPDYRGQGINKNMSQLRIESAQQAGIKYLISTVHPDNHPSMRSLKAIGMRQIAQRPMFQEQLLRNVMFKEI
ncbi:GNAT family N-acetyltransferase [Neptunomonas japonica]|uniref:GNAT family N-acetyltransferase n=1 Tax=Neptunomonas japonica TaxID=417574 RepID=UPI000420F86F|nr:GNAT family N-acetyltransferase [Neptunomonas japonica]